MCGGARASSTSRPRNPKRTPSLTSRPRPQTNPKPRRALELGALDGRRAVELGAAAGAEM